MLARFSGANFELQNDLSNCSVATAGMSNSTSLPPGIKVFERGWLSANNILFSSGQTTALVDSGYCTHSNQTVQLVEKALGGRTLDFLVNTHLHSDHCGGNAALQAQFPLLKTFIPPGLAEHVRQWDPSALTYVPTGQECPKFEIHGVLGGGAQIQLADRLWEVHAAPGHDAHSIILFEPDSRALISADALWENGFGVVFQELEGDRAFDEVSATLDLIEDLDPLTVIPGHGRVFSNTNLALTTARRRLDGFLADPCKHATHAAKVLLKFKLLEAHQLPMPALLQWARATPYFDLIHQRWFADQALGAWLEHTIQALCLSGALELHNDMVNNR